MAMHIALVLPSNPQLIVARSDYFPPEGYVQSINIAVTNKKIRAAES